ncbi:hypothetical protein Tco_1350521 [Tanacetum coccineum]
MNRSLFTRIVRDLSANCPNFQEGCDAVEKGKAISLEFYPEEQHREDDPSPSIKGPFGLWTGLGLGFGFRFKFGFGFRFEY